MLHLRANSCDCFFAGCYFSKFPRKIDEITSVLDSDSSTEQKIFSVKDQECLLNNKKDKGLTSGLMALS